MWVSVCMLRIERELGPSIKDKSVRMRECESERANESEKERGEFEQERVI